MISIHMPKNTSALWIQIRCSGKKPVFKLHGKQGRRPGTKHAKNSETR